MQFTWKGRATKEKKSSSSNHLRGKQLKKKSEHLLLQNHGRKRKKLKMKF